MYPAVAIGDDQRTIVRQASTVEIVTAAVANHGLLGRY
jgi:hypothetical protein